MRFRWTLTALLVASLLPAVALLPVGAGTRAPRALRVEGEVLVTYRAGAGAADTLRTERAARAVGGRALRWGRVRRLRLGPGTSTDAAMRALSQDPAVEAVQPNYLYRASDLPNDPRCQDGSLWAFHNTGQYGGLAGADIDAGPAWSLSTGSPDVVVAVIDSGVDTAHPDLAPNLWTNPGEVPGNGIDDDRNGYVDDVHGWDAFENDGDPQDDLDHGTHVAGTIGACGNDGAGVSGVNWSVRIVAARFIGADGYGSTADVLECLDYVHQLKDRGVNVVATNNSWSGGGNDPALRGAIQASNDRGILFVTAAGNGDGFGRPVDTDRIPIYPGSLKTPNIITVTATDRTDKRAYWANYGSTGVDLGAPGVDIWSTIPGAQYGSYSGTSMAAPHVTGAAALLAAYDPSLTAAQIKSRLLNTGDPNADLQGKTVSGRRLNLYNALTDTVPVVPVVPALKAVVTTNKTSYRPGQTMVITVTVTSAGRPISGAAVYATIVTPRGTSYPRTASTRTNGVAQLSYTVRQSDGSGTFSVSVTASKTGYASASGSTSVRATRR